MHRAYVRLLAVGLMLAVVLAGLPVVAFAEADPVLVTTDPAKGSDLEVAGQQVKITLVITPQTDFSTGTLQAVTWYFRRNGVTVSTAVYYPSVPGFVYNQSGTSIDVVYALPAGFGQYGVKLGDVNSTVTSTVYGPTVSVAVYVDEKAAPSGGGGAGGGAGGGTTTGGTTGTTTGWQTYDQTADTATVYVDPEKTKTMYASAPTSGLVLVEPPAVGAGGTVPSNVTASLPLAVVNQGGQATVPSVLSMGVADIVLPPAVMADLGKKVTEVAGAIANLKVKVTTSTEEDTQTVLQQAAGDLSDFSAASRIVRIVFVAVDAQGRETQVPVDQTTVKIKFDSSKVKDPAKVNLYRIGSLIYVGGKVDVAGKTVSGSVSGLKDARVVALEYDKSFSDIPGHWAQADIELMASKYVVKGMTETTFEPESQVTRAQFVTLLVRALGLSEYNPTSPTFSDVKPEAWYYGYVEAAHMAGLALGYDGTFKPEDRVSREEMAAFLVRAMKQGGKEPSVVSDVARVLASFTDASSISDWARIEVAQAVTEGLVRGYPNGQFSPIGEASRAEAATTMSRFMKQVGKI